MDLFTRITSLGRVKKMISLLSILFLTNSLITIASENRSNFSKSSLTDNDFEKVYNSNTVPFEEHDNPENQFRTFFGFYSIESERSYFKDLSIEDESESLRRMYKTKLDDMTINKNNNKIK